VRRCRESGQSVRAFCRTEGVRESAFYFWRRELVRRDCQAGGNGSRAEGSSATPTSRSAERRLPRHGPTPSFLPVHVVKPDLVEVGRAVEIVLERGRTVRVPPGFDRQTLADVLAVLEVRPC
jgi:transposase-like protein